MSRSQRHRVLFENYSVMGLGVAEGAIAPAYTLQLSAVPVGPPGGPLQGSSLSGPVPATLPQPRLEHPVLAAGVILGAGGGPLEPPAQTTSTERTFPIGPVSLTSVDDDPQGIAYTVPDGTDIQVGDVVVIEATGNSATNGIFTVLSVNGDVVVVDNTYELAAPIEAKGRLTVTEAG